MTIKLHHEESEKASQRIRDVLHNIKLIKDSYTKCIKKYYKSLRKKNL